jgi:hypothetical protein
VDTVAATLATKARKHEKDLLGFVFSRFRGDLPGVANPVPSGSAGPALTAVFWIAA